MRLASLVPYQIFSKDKTLNLVFERGAAAAAADEPGEPSTTEPKLVDAPPAEAADRAARRGRSPPQRAPRRRPRRPSPRRKAPVAGDRAPASSASTHRMTNGSVAVTVKADGTLRYQDFFLGNPDRLVIDFTDVVSRRQRSVPRSTRTRCARVRLAQFSADSRRWRRLVLDLSARTPYRIVDGADGMKIVFGERGRHTRAR